MSAHMRKTTGAVQCPRCGRLVGATEPSCPNCGAWQPGLFGYGPWIQRTFGNVDLSNVITVVCVVLYLLSLAIDVQGIQFAGGLFNLLSPSSVALFKLGMTGQTVTALGWWWTLCTAVFLHGSVLHIAFNLAIMRRYLPMVEHLFGTGRAFVIFMAAGVGGFLLSDLLSHAPTIGASGAIFGLLAALISYGRRTGQSQVTQQLSTSALVMFAYGFFMPSVNNWAHAGGFIGGFLAAELMPTSGQRESAIIWVLCGVATLVTLAGFVLSFLGVMRMGG
jgi:rhomboid protease GluP